MRIILVFILFTFASCASNRPVATTHTERIEERVMPILVGADTIEITEYRLQSTDTPCSLLPTPCSIKSTRGVNISRHETDTTSTLRITLRPDTVFVPYMTHIRSDTIVAPCPTTQAKLTTARWQIFALILILIAIIIYRLKPFFINP